MLLLCLINAIVYKYYQWAMVDQYELSLAVTYFRKLSTSIERRVSAISNCDMSSITNRSKCQWFQVNSHFVILTKLIPLEETWYTTIFNYSRDNWLYLKYSIKYRESHFYFVLNQTHRKYIK